MSDTNKPAAQLEAEGEKLATFTWEGLELTFLIDLDEWDGRAAFFLEEGKPLKATLVALGDDQAAKVWDKNPTRKQLRELYVGLFQKVADLKAGE